MAKKYTLHQVRQLKSSPRSRTSGELLKEIFWDDLDNIENAINAFAELMRDEMFDRSAEGDEGWQDSEYEEQIKKHLADHIKRGKWVGVANFCMMLHRFKEQL